VVFHAGVKGSLVTGYVATETCVIMHLRLASQLLVHFYERTTNFLQDDFQGWRHAALVFMGQPFCIAI
jgi:hypothetical protein